MKKLLCILLSLALMIGSVTAFAEEKPKEAAKITYGPKLGVTLYTVRNEYNAMRQAALDAGKTNQEAATTALTKTLRRIAAMGYKGYQPNHADTNWWDMDASQLKALNKELGLTLISPHWVPAWNYSKEELSKTLDYLNEAGATGITLDISFPPTEGFVWGNRLTQKMMTDWVKDVMKKLHFMQDTIAKKGYNLRVGFHAHSMEWIPVESYGGRYFLDILYDEFGDTVDLHFDTSHMVYPNVGFNAIYPYDFPGEEGLIKYLWAHGNQYNMIHVKDVDCEGYYTTACGQGDIEWNEVIRALAYHKLDWMLVEDNSPEKLNRDGFGSIKVSIDYFNEMFTSLGLTHPKD